MARALRASSPHRRSAPAVAVMTRGWEPCLHSTRRRRTDLRPSVTKECQVGDEPHSRPATGTPMKTAMFDIDDALRYLIVHEGSDLHLKVPSQPIVRVHGNMEPIDGSERLKPEDTERVLREV